jgi:glutamate synthase domain-containing protein 3
MKLTSQIIEKTENEITIDAMRDGSPIAYRELNEIIHNAHDEGIPTINLKNVYGQRFICAGMEGKCTVNIYGTPGNDLGVFMEGPTINVFGSSEDQSGNTMNQGKIIIHGNAWDVTGLAARGGSIFVKGNGGYRVGIHMKEYKNKRPVVVYGGVVKEFFGEYMAGGLLVALGLQEKDGKWENNPMQIARGSLGTGIHGGAIYLRGEVDPSWLGVAAVISEISSKDKRLLDKAIKEFCKHFNAPSELIYSKEFTKIAAGSARPFAHFYCPNPV